jgi:hypothetical protein
MLVSKFPRDLNNLIIIKYLDDLDRFILSHVYGGNLPFDSNFVYFATKKGYLNILIWMENFQEFEFLKETIIIIASHNGQLDIIKRYQEHITPGSIVDPACFGGQLHILQWFDDSCNYKEWRHQDSSVSQAAYNGHLHILRWFHCKGYKISKRIFNSAILGGHIDVLEWLYSPGCASTAEMIMGGVAAAIEGHLHVLHWMHSKGILCDAEDCLEVAISNGKTEIEHWLMTIIYPSKTEIPLLEFVKY